MPPGYGCALWQTFRSLTRSSTGADARRYGLFRACAEDPLQRLSCCKELDLRERMQDVYGSTRTILAGSTRCACPVASLPSMAKVGIEPHLP